MVKGMDISWGNDIVSNLSRHRAYRRCGSVEGRKEYIEVRKGRL
jgi:hypothetical protein